MELTTTGRYRVLASPRDRPELLLVDRSAAPGDDVAAGTAGEETDDGETEDAYAPVYVRTDGYDEPDGGSGGDASVGDAPVGAPDSDPGSEPAADLAATVESLEPGNVVEATLRWEDGEARFVAVEVLRRTRFWFGDEVTGIFEAARETWRDAAAAGEAMNSRVTRSTDGEPNGALYVFAEQPGARDLLAEFRDGSLPLDPLLDRVDEAGDEGVAEGTAAADTAVVGDGSADADPAGDDPHDARAVFVLRPADEPFVAVYIVFSRNGVLARTVRDTYDLD